MKNKYIKKDLFKNKKVVFIIAVILVLGGFVVAYKFKYANDSSEFEFIQSENIVKLKKGDINNSVIVSGKIKSGEVSNVSSTISSKVKSVNVKVGDTVNEGDIICVLDDSNIIKEIESKSKIIEEEKKVLKENYNNISNQINNLKITHSENSNRQNKEIEIAKNNFNNANVALKNYEPIFNNAKNMYNLMISGIKDAQTNYDNAEAKKKQCYEIWINSGGGVDSQEYKNYIEASDNLVRMEEELNKAKDLYDYDNITNKYNESLTIYNEKVSIRDAAKAQYDEATSNSVISANANKAEIIALQNNINEINKQIQKLNDNEELKELKENLKKTVLKAETSGKITELKVNVGSVAEGIVATIQSTDNLILEVNIPETDIKNISIGMTAKITSNSLDDKFDGELVSISPIADSEEKSGFSANIAIKNGSGLFIGTNAKAEIIISSKENVILAPIDSIKDIDTNPKIILNDANGELKEVPVIIGEKNDYYVEISGDNIKEGIEIQKNINSYDNEFYNNTDNRR